MPMVPIKFADGNYSCRQPRVREALVNDVTDIICVTVIMAARFALTDPANRRKNLQGFGEDSFLKVSTLFMTYTNMSYGATVGASAANRNLIEFKK